MLRNITLLTDSYKPSHWRQYPPKTETVYSYFESRGAFTDEIVFFGLQYLLKEYFEGHVLKLSDIDIAANFYGKHLGPDIFNYDGWMKLLRKHDGKLPVEICAVPEGTVWPVRTPLMTVENTDPEFPWLTNYLETLLVQMWYPSTVATFSREAKKTILEFLEETGNPDLIGFKLHDFGFRGVSSVESAEIGGMAHLVNFMGSDTVAGIIAAQMYYGGAEMPAFSIPASEHSTITAWGEENEAKAYKNMLDSFPTGLVAVVSDSYDIWNACRNVWGDQLKSQVMEREGTLVIRPDSGDPVYVVKNVLQILGEQFGYTHNAKGYKVLPDQVRVIQGDGVNLESIRAILTELRYFGWSADNVAFGMGGALLQKCDRDTFNFAMKAAEVTIDGVAHDVFKKPVTQVMKASTGGRKSVKINGEEMLKPVFRNGEILKSYDFNEVRANANVLERVS